MKYKPDRPIKDISNQESNKPENLESVQNATGFKTIFSDSTVNFISKILSNLEYLLFITFLIKFLGEKKYGEFSIFLMVVQFIYTGFILWLVSGIIKFGREEFIQQNKINKIFSAHIITSVPIISILILIVFIFREIILAYLKFNSLFIFIIIAYFCFNYLLELFYYLLQSIGKIKLMSIAQIIEKTIPLIVVLVVFYLFKTTKLVYVIFSLLTGYIFSISIIFFNIKKTIVFPFNLEKKLYSRYIKFSIPIFFSAIFGYICRWIDIAILKKYFAIQTVGQYFYCQQIYNGLNQISLVAVVIVIPLAVSLIVKKRKDLSEKLINDLSTVGMVIFFLIVNFIWLFFSLILSLLFKQNLFEISLMMNILMFALPINLFIVILNSFIYGYELMWAFAFVNILNVITKILFSYILIFNIGMIGGSIATFLVLLVNSIFGCMIVKSRLNINVKKNYYLIILFILLIITYCLIKNAILCFFINIFTIIIFIKVFKIFSKDKIEILNKIDIPDFIKKKLFLFIKLGLF